jgi:hypothetical protein
MDTTPPPPRRDRKRLIGCGVVLVILVALVVLAAYGLGLWGSGQRAAARTPKLLGENCQCQRTPQTIGAAGQWPQADVRSAAIRRCSAS